MDINKTTLIGRLVSKPTKKDEQVLFRIATNYQWQYKNKELNKKEVHDITIIDKKLMEIVMMYVEKGSRLYLEGQIHNKNIIVDEIIMLGSNK